MFAHILVPLDGSPFSEAALPAAEALARKCGAEVRLLSVLEIPPLLAYPEYRSENRERFEAYLRGLAKRIAATGVRVTCTVQEGHVGPGILRDAADSDADLIVMSTTGAAGCRGSGSGASQTGASGAPSGRFC